MPSNLEKGQVFFFGIVAKCVSLRKRLEADKRDAGVKPRDSPRTLSAQFQFARGPRAADGK